MEVQQVNTTNKPRNKQIIISGARLLHVEVHEVNKTKKKPTKISREYV